MHATQHEEAQAAKLEMLACTQPGSAQQQRLRLHTHTL